MINRHLAHLWRQMKIRRILTHVCLHQIGCLCYCCYAKTSSSAVQKRHSKVYGNLIAPPSIQFSWVRPESLIIMKYAVRSRCSFLAYTISKISVHHHSIHYNLVWFELDIHVFVVKNCLFSCVVIYAFIVSETMEK